VITEVHRPAKFLADSLASIWYFSADEAVTAESGRKSGGLPMRISTSENVPLELGQPDIEEYLGTINAAHVPSFPGEPRSRNRNAPSVLVVF